MQLGKNQAVRLAASVRQAFRELVDPGEPTLCASAAEAAAAIAARLPAALGRQRSLQEVVLDRIRELFDDPTIEAGTALELILPRTVRRARWRLLRREYPRCLPALAVNKSANMVIAVASGVLGGYLFADTGFSGAVAGAIAAGLLGQFVSRPFLVNLPLNVYRVKTVIDRVLARPAVFRHADVRWTPARVLEVVRAIAQTNGRHGVDESTTFALPVPLP